MFSLGTPNENIWPGVSSLPYYTLDFPQWLPTLTLNKYIHITNNKSEEILKSCLCYIPEQRLTTKQALQHRYFHNENE